MTPDVTSDGFMVAARRTSDIPAPVDSHEMSPHAFVRLDAPVTSSNRCSDSRRWHRRLGWPVIHNLDDAPADRPAMGLQCRKSQKLPTRRP